MKNISHNKKIWRAFWAVASFICMIVIFFMSHQPADKSTEMSDVIVDELIKLGISETGAGNIDTIVRKLAHMLEYFVLSTCVSMYMLAGRRKLCFKTCAGVLGFCMTYAVSDEVHQLFIEGRSGQIRDVLIDTGGALIALSLIVIISKSIKRINR